MSWPANPTSQPRRFGTERALVQFLALGCGLYFLARSQTDARDPASLRVVVNAGQIESLTAQFERGWHRAPSPSELQGLVEEFVKEEILVREAIALGLDDGDPILRRRLRQKFEALAVDDGRLTEPTDDQLRAFAKSHPEVRAEVLRMFGVSGDESNALEFATTDGAAVRAALREAWFAARRGEALDREFLRLRARYRIVVERASR